MSDGEVEDIKFFVRAHVGVHGCGVAWFFWVQMEARVNFWYYSSDAHLVFVCLFFRQGLTQFGASSSSPGWLASKPQGSS